MGRRIAAGVCSAVGALALAPVLPGQTAAPSFQVDVNLVELTVAVKNKAGKPVTGLRAQDFGVYEDGIPQRIRAFSEGAAPGGPLGGRSVFVLFDTSNAMYEEFARADEAICGFVRSLDPSTSVAVSTLSRNMYRAVGLTRDRGEAISKLREAVAGADTALFNAMLLTVRDAARVSGPKAIVVFSNGPDNASVIGPDDVRRLAEDEGIPVYVVSTAKKADPTGAALERLTRGTGGRMFYAPTWQVQAKAFDAIRAELAGSYVIGYYPEANPNRGFRKITVEVAGRRGVGVTTRAGYRPRPEAEQSASAARLAPASAQ